MKIDEKIKRAVYLNEQIREIDYFITTIDVTSWGYKHVDIGLITETHETRRFKLMANRCFGIGTHKSNIDIPVEMIPDILKLAKERRVCLEKELNEIIK